MPSLKQRKVAIVGSRSVGMYFHRCLSKQSSSVLLVSPTARMLSALLKSPESSLPYLVMRSKQTQALLR